MVGVYAGEWSSLTHKPHGRGVFVSQDGKIFFSYFENGSLNCERKLVSLNLLKRAFCVGTVERINGDLHQRNKGYWQGGIIRG